MTKGEKCIKFLEHLKYPEGTDWYGQPVKLLDWQKSNILALLDSEPAIKELSLWVGRGNGKTTYIAFLVVYFLFSRQNQSIVITANTKDEASQLYRFVSSIIQQDDYLNRHAKVYKGNVKKVDCHLTKSTFTVFSSVFEGKLGGNVSIYIAEECGHYEDRQVYEAITTSMGKRLSETLIVNISTAGNDFTSFGYELYQKAKDNKDPQHLVALFQGNPKLWDDVEEWYRCNPSLKELANRDYITRKIDSAKLFPNEVASLIRYHLNVWQESADDPAIPLDRWDSCDEKIDLASLKGKPSYCGIDIGSTDDFSSVVFEFVIDGKYVLLPHYFTPADTLAQRAQRDKQPYQAWKQQGLITTVPGDRMDSDVILTYLKAQRDNYQIKDIAVDRYFNSNDLILNLSKEGFRVTPIGSGTITIAPTLKDFVTQISMKKIIHLNNPILRWNCSNARSYIADENGNVMISKKRSKGKTDGLMASLYAHSRMMFHKNKGAGTVSFVRF